MPRVIAGSARRLQLQAPRGQQTRPTADKTKESLFNILESRRSCEGMRVLELFAGSGQLAIEALSRGAEHAILVDSARAVRGIIEHNLQHTHLSDRATIRTASALSVLRELEQEGRTFDLILIDPPYAQAAAFWSSALPLLNRVLAPEGILVWEQSSREEEPEIVTGLKPIKHCQSGAAMLVFYMNHSAQTCITEQSEEGHSCEDTRISGDI